MDICGAVDNISTESIRKAMAKHDVDEIIQSWCGHYLEKRQCSAQLGDAEVHADIERGSPQGGASLLVVLWFMSFDELLILHDTYSTEVIGFVDNLCLLQTGIDLGTVMRQAQFSINKAVRWATDWGRTFCPKKKAMLLFTKKKQSFYKQQHNLSERTTTLVFSSWVTL
jgi:hypothetical protein